jgi:carotenoid cleavage dioxygenase-like enzyme
MPSSAAPPSQPSHEIELEIRGALPPQLSGRLIGIDPDGYVHSFLLHGGRATYAASLVRPPTRVRDVVASDRSILVCGDDSKVYELSADEGNLHRVDIAGQQREISTCPTFDRATGELHLVARDADSSQFHVVIPAGALTRRSRPIVDAPRQIRGLALGRDHAVFTADDVVGVTSRVGEMRTTWIATGADPGRPLCAYGAGATIVLLTLTPRLERWALNPAGGSIECHVIDPTARHFTRKGLVGPDGPPQYVWTTGDETISRHDLIESRNLRLDLTPLEPGDFVLIPDATRPGAIDAGWFVGLVLDAAVHTAELWVIDLADLAGPTVATIHVPGRVPRNLRCEWLPSTANSPNTAITTDPRSNKP